jgi:hypothetical protein
MAQKINPIFFRKTTKGLYFVSNKHSLGKTLASYPLKNYNQVHYYLKSVFNFLGLHLDSIFSMETNNSVFFLSLKYRSQNLKKAVAYENTILKQTIIKGLLKIFPVKNLYLRLLNNKKIFISDKRKKKFLRVLRNIHLISFDPFNLAKILRYSFFSSSIVGHILARELVLTKNHSRVLTLCGKILSLCVGGNSKIKGVKICVKGKFNGRLRSKIRVLQLGNLWLQKYLSVVDFFCTKAVTSVGVFGIKIWIHY